VLDVKRPVLFASVDPPQIVKSGLTDRLTLNMKLYKIIILSVVFMVMKLGFLPSKVVTVRRSFAYRVGFEVIAAAVMKVSIS
jgi:hypothetical protein